VDSNDSTETEPTATPRRKAEHLRINLEEDVAAKGVSPGFERFRFIPRALPGVDFSQVSTATELFGHRLGAPLFISCMTGGVTEAQIINTRLAWTAQRFGLALGLGSARVLLEHPEVLPTFAVRPFAPDVLIFANLGAIQLNRGVTVDQCRYLVDMLQADALVLHLNALQEALQPEGDTNFAGLLRQIETLCRESDVPIIAKEVGWGIAPDDVQALLAVGVAAVDIAGAGGTSWSEVERYRMEGTVRQATAAAFADWGLPTADAVALARQAAPNATIFASGGIRSGMDLAKALALGGNLAGAAGPFLRAAAEGEDASNDLAETFINVLRTVMFCVGAASVDAFRADPRLATIGPSGETIPPAPATTTDPSKRWL
jgi:isopentenyl-diphosphate delta-isomerase